MAVEGGGDYRQRLVQRQLQIKKRKKAGLSNTRADAGPPSSKTFSSPPKREDTPNTFNRIVDAGKGFGQQTFTDFALGLTKPVYKLADFVGAPDEGIIGKEQFLRGQAQLFTGFGSLAPEEEFINRVRQDTKEYSGKELASDILASYANFIGPGWGAATSKALSPAVRLANSIASGAVRGVESTVPKTGLAAALVGGGVTTRIPRGMAGKSSRYTPYGAAASQTANISKATGNEEDWWNLSGPTDAEVRASGRKFQQEAVIEPGDDIAAAWSRGEFEPAFEVLETAWKNRKGNSTVIDNVPPAIVEALSRGIKPSEIRLYADDIIKGAGDPAMAKAGQKIEVIWSRDPKKNIKQFLSVRRGGIERTAKTSNVDKSWLAEGTDQIKAEDAVAEFNKFREQTGMPSEVRVYNEKGDVVQYLHPHIDHFMSASAIGAYARILRQKGKGALADKMLKSANTRDNMLVYYAPDNTNKGRISPDIWEKQLSETAPEHYAAVHGENTYAKNRYAEARKYWRDLLGDEEYGAFMDWYNTESLNPNSPQLYPEKVKPESIFTEMMRTLQGM